jgi:hypothetical protein
MIVGIVSGLALMLGGALVLAEPNQLLADLRLPGATARSRRMRGVAVDFMSSVVPYLGPSFVRAYRFLEATPATLLGPAAVGVGMVGVFALALGGPKMAPLGLLGLVYPVVALPMQADGARRRLVAQLPDFGLYLGIFLELGYSMHRAMAEATKYMTGPLRKELDRVLTRLVVEPNPEAAIRSLSDRIGNPDAALFFDAVLAGWNTDAPVAVMRGITETMDRLRDGAITARTGRIPNTMQVLILVALVDTLLLWGVPFITSMMAHMSAFSGGL